jgi:hypothetical protein
VDCRKKLTIHHLKSLQEKDHVKRYAGGRNFMEGRPTNGRKSIGRGPREYDRRQKFAEDVCR